MIYPVAALPRWLLRSLVLFALIFGLLILPWPGFDELYGAYFRAFGTWTIARDDSPRVVIFERQILVHDFSILNTRMTLGNRLLADANGNGRALRTALDTRSIGWIPTALTVSLIVATPIPWRRKLVALLWGLVLVHLLIFFSLQTCIWRDSTSLGLLHLTPFWQQVCDGLRDTFVTQLGVSFTVPVLIWLLVCFQKQDAEAIFGAGEIQKSFTKTTSNRGTGNLKLSKKKPR